MRGSTDSDTPVSALAQMRQPATSPSRGFCAAAVGEVMVAGRSLTGGGNGTLCPREGTLTGFRPGIVGVGRRGMEGGAATGFKVGKGGGPATGFGREGGRGLVAGALTSGRGGG